MGCGARCRRRPARAQRRRGAARGPARAVPARPRPAPAVGADRPGHRRDLRPPGRRLAGGPQRPARHGRDRHRQRQVAGLQPPGAGEPGRAARHAGAVHLPHEGAGPGPGAPAGRVPHGQAGDLRRRHAAQQPALDPPLREPGADQPGHAARRRAAEPRPLAPAALGAHPRGHRRGARLPRGVRLARGLRPSAPAAGLRAVRLRPPVPAGVGDGGQPGRGRPGPDRARRRGRRRRPRAAGPAPDRVLAAAAARRRGRRAGLHAGRGRRACWRRWSAAGSAPSASARPARPPSSSSGSPGTRSRPAGSRRPPPASLPTAPATPPRSGGPSRPTCARASCSAWWPPTPSSSGIDVGLLDCAIATGFPGTVASLRQQWGRAGRRGEGLAVFIPSDDGLDQFFARHPEALLERSVEAAILDPTSREIRTGHLLAAADEVPLREADDAVLGEGAYEAARELRELVPDAARPDLERPRLARRPGRPALGQRVEHHRGRGVDRDDPRHRRGGPRPVDGARGRRLPAPRRGPPRHPPRPRRPGGAGRAARRRLLHPAPPRDRPAHRRGARRARAARGRPPVLRPGRRDRARRRLPAPPAAGPRADRHRPARPARAPLLDHRPVVRAAVRPARTAARWARCTPPSTP